MGFIPDDILDAYTKPARPRSEPLSRDEDLAVRTIIGEAKGEGEKGWEAVADVIRTRAKQSGKSFADVVLAPSQFEPWQSRRKELESYDPDSPTYRRVAQTVLPVLRGERKGPVGDMTHFYSPTVQAAMGRKPPEWAKGPGFAFGNHRFYNLGYGGKGKHGTEKAKVSAFASLDELTDAYGGSATRAPSPTSFDEIANLYAQPEDKPLVTPTPTVPGQKPLIAPGQPLPPDVPIQTVQSAPIQPEKPLIAPGQPLPPDVPIQTPPIQTDIDRSIYGGMDRITFPNVDELTQISEAAKEGKEYKDNYAVQTRFNLEQIKNPNLTVDEFNRQLQAEFEAQRVNQEREFFEKNKDYAEWLKGTEQTDSNEARQEFNRIMGGVTDTVNEQNRADTAAWNKNRRNEIAEYNKRTARPATPAATRSVVKVPAPEGYGDERYEIPLHPNADESVVNDEIASRIANRYNVDYEIARKIVGDEKAEVEGAPNIAAKDYIRQQAQAGQAHRTVVGGSVIRKIVEADKDIKERRAKAERLAADRIANIKDADIADRDASEFEARIQAQVEMGLMKPEDAQKAIEKVRSDVRAWKEDRGFLGLGNEEDWARFWSMLDGEEGQTRYTESRGELPVKSTPRKSYKEYYDQAYKDIITQYGNKDEIAKYGPATAISHAIDERRRFRERFKDAPYTYIAKQLETFVGGVGKVPFKTVGAILESVAIGSEAVERLTGGDLGDPDDPDARQKVTYKLGQDLKALAEAVPIDKDFRGGAMEIGGDVLGQVVTQALTGVATKSAAIPALLGAAMGGSAQYEEAAKNPNSTPGQRIGAFIAAGLLSVPDYFIFRSIIKGKRLLEAAPFLNRFTNSVKEGLIKKGWIEPAARTTAASITDGFITEMVERGGWRGMIGRSLPVSQRAVALGAGEGGQEVSETKGNDLFAYLTYDPTPERWNKLVGINKENIIEGVAGFFGGLIGAGIGEIQARASNLSEEAREQAKDLLEQYKDDLPEQTYDAVLAGLDAAVERVKQGVRDQFAPVASDVVDAARRKDPAEVPDDQDAETKIPQPPTPAVTPEVVSAEKAEKVDLPSNKKAPQTKAETPKGDLVSKEIPPADVESSDDVSGDKIPTVSEYSDYVQKAVGKFKMSAEDVRTKYGKYTTKQWEELLTETPKPSGDTKVELKPGKNRPADLPESVEWTERDDYIQSVIDSTPRKDLRGTGLNEVVNKAGAEWDAQNQPQTPATDADTQETKAPSPEKGAKVTLKSDKDTLEVKSNLTSPIRSRTRELGLIRPKEVKEIAPSKLESSVSSDVSGEVKPLAPEAQAQIKKWERHASNATDANLHKMAATLESRAESSPSRRARLRIIEAELKRRQTTDDREAWQIPKNEFAQGDAQKALEHKAVVRRAVKRGQTVPPEVLADYPDLAEKTTTARDTRKTQETKDEISPARSPALEARKQRAADRKAERMAAKPDLSTIQKNDKVIHRGKEYEVMFPPNAKGYTMLRDPSTKAGGRLVKSESITPISQPKPAVKAKQEATIESAKAIAVPRSAAKRYSYADEVADQIASPEFKEAEARSARETESSRTGFTKTQTEWLAKALQDYAKEYGDAEYAGKSRNFNPNKDLFSSREEEIRPETIAVPDDGVIRITDLQQANRLHQMVTGKPFAGLPKEVTTRAKTNFEKFLDETRMPSRAQVSNLQRANMLKRMDRDDDLEIPIDELDANYVGGKTLESSTLYVEEGWVRSTLGNQTVFTNDHMFLASDTPFSKKETKKNPPPDIDGFVKKELDKKPKEVNPLRAIRTGMKVAVEFDNGAQVDFQYYNLIKANYPDATFKGTDAGGALTVYDDGKLVGAAMPLSDKSRRVESALVKQRKQKAPTVEKDATTQEPLRAVPEDVKPKLLDFYQQAFTLPSIEGKNAEQRTILKHLKQKESALQALVKCIHK